nr:hypothetical protein [uncultured Ruminococcus sp.]
MKQKYEKSILTITRFSDEDVITTSDRNNAYKSLSELNAQEERAVPQTR